MQRRALSVAGAAGPADDANGVLQRFGFSSLEEVDSLATAASHLRNAHYDIVFVPLQTLGAVELSLLERDIRREGSTFVIGTAPHNDPEVILRAMRSGVHEFLVFPPAPAELTAAAERLMRRTAAETQRGSVFAVYSAKGGLGTTSVAVNLAQALARLNPSNRVGLADFVVSGGDIRVLLDLKPSYDIGDLASKVDQIDDDLLFSVLTARAGGTWVLASSEHPEVSELLDGAAAASIIAHMRTSFAHTVIDCEHHMTERTLAALDVADRILLVTQLTVPGVRSTRRVIELCERLGYPSSKLLVVVNRHHSGDVVTVADAAGVLGAEIYWKLPNDYRTSGDALTSGVTVVEHAPSSSLAGSYVQLAAKLSGVARPATSNGDHRGGSRLGRLLRIGRKS